MTPERRPDGDGHQNGGKGSWESKIGGKRRSFLKATGVGIGASVLGGTTIASVAAQSSDSLYTQVDLVEGSSTKDPLTADGSTYSDDDRLVTWSWADVDAQSVGETGDRTGDTFGANDVTVTVTSDISFDYGAETAEVSFDVDGDIDLTLVSYLAPDNGYAEWDPEAADSQEVYDSTTGAYTSGDSDTLTVDIPSRTGDGEIEREYWLGINDAESIDDIPTETEPDGTETITDAFEGPQDWDDDYGARFEGYLTAPETGDYTFWIASDDDSDLYLSTDDTAANASVIAHSHGWVWHEEWNAQDSQESDPISLTAGKEYYVKVLHREGGGGDHVTVGWRKPSDGDGGEPAEVVPAEQLSPYDDGTGDVPT